MTALLLLMVTILCGVALPAYAAAFTTYQTRITAISPSVAGLSATAAISGEGITVTNTSDQPVVIEGYQGEPYVKITRAGVWQNDLSPAVYLNKEQTIGNFPKDANADQKPKWTQLSTNHRFQWHDHRIHWMGVAVPPIVSKDPGHPHLISTWTIPMVVGTTTGGITGTLSYAPGSHWGKYLPYAAVALGVIVVVAVQVLVVRRRARPDAELARASSAERGAGRP